MSDFVHLYCPVCIRSLRVYQPPSLFIYIYIHVHNIYTYTYTFRSSFILFWVTIVYLLDLLRYVPRNVSRRLK